MELVGRTSDFRRNLVVSSGIDDIFISSTIPRRMRDMRSRENFLKVLGSNTSCIFCLRYSSVLWHSGSQLHIWWYSYRCWVSSQSFLDMMLLIFRFVESRSVSKIIWSWRISLIRSRRIARSLRSKIQWNADVEISRCWRKNKCMVPLCLYLIWLCRGEG